MAQGRRGSTRKQRQSLIAQLKTSGLSQKEFAEREGVPLSTLTYWMRRERLEAKLSGNTELVAVSDGSSQPAPSLSMNSFFVLECGGFRVEVPRDASVEEWQRLREALIS